MDFSIPFGTMTITKECSFTCLDVKNIQSYSVFTHYNISVVRKPRRKKNNQEKYDPLMNANKNKFKVKGHTGVFKSEVAFKWSQTFGHHYI